MLGERRREIESRQAALLDEDLAEADAGSELLREGGIELRPRDEPELDEDLTERPPALGIVRGRPRRGASCRSVASIQHVSATDAAEE